MFLVWDDPEGRTMDLEQSGAGFVTTCWSLIDLARGGTPQQREQAQNELVRLYWAPVYSFIRRSGVKREEAAERTQAFFAKVIVGRGLFQRAREDRGSLRGLMRVALKNFLRDAVRHNRAHGSLLQVPIESIVHEEELLARHATLTPEELFERRWRLAMVAEALARCREHYRQLGKQQHWHLFEARVLRPSLNGGSAPPLAVAAKEHGFKTPADAAAAVQTVKRRLHALLGERIE